MYNIHTQIVGFEWDEDKNRENIRKHGISFEEALTAFKDKHAPCSFDPEHSNEEDRFLLLGMSSRLRVIVVCHCYRINGSTIRIISARKATNHETKDYRRYNAG
jgi:uncharacterized DUF497 family protein